jgi:hypothetical protein
LVCELCKYKHVKHVCTWFKHRISILYIYSTWPIPVVLVWITCHWRLLQYAYRRSQYM